MKQNKFIKLLRFLVLLAVIVCFETATQAQEAYAVYTNDGTLTFYYDNQKSSRSGKTYILNTGTETPGWNSYSSSITKVIITPSFSGVRPTSTYRWFCNASSMYQSKLSDIEGLENLNTSEVKNMSYMFYRCIRLTSLDLSHFDTRNVTTMSHMFGDCYILESINISSFDTSNVTDMQSMFSHCSKLKSLDLANFSTSKVSIMYRMFANCDKLTNIDLSNFDTSKANNMEEMFYGCDNLTNINLSSFDTSLVTNMSGMFQDCRSLENLDLSSFKTDAVMEMRNMFWSCKNLTTIFVSENWSTRNVTKYNSEKQFLSCTSLVGGAGTVYDANHVDVDYAHIDGGVSNPGYLTNKNAPQADEAYAVYTTDGTLTFYCDNQKSSRSGTKYELNTGMTFPGWFTDHRADIKKAVFTSSFAAARPTSTFSWFFTSQNGGSALTEITGLQYLNTSEVTTMYYMFYGSDKLTSLDVSHFNTSKVTNMREMFRGCSSLTSLDVSNFDTRNVTTMQLMFYHCSSLKNLDVSHFNTSNVTSMNNMFGYCNGLTNLDVSNFDTGNVKDFSSMFMSCSGLTNIDVTHFNTSKAVYMGGMFAMCTGLTVLDLSNFETSNVTDMEEEGMGMFAYSSNLTTIYAGEGWNTDKVTRYAGMFQECISLIGGAGTKYDASHTGVGYAHIDGGVSNPGYLTDKNAEAEDLCDADDLLRFIENLTGTTTTNDNPAEATLCDEPTIDQDVDIEDDLWLYLYGDDNATPPVMNFYGGAINLKSRNGGWTFKGVGFTSNAGATAPLRAAGEPGGITSIGTLTFDGCTLKEGSYAVQNLSDGRMYLSGGTMVEGYGNLVNNGNVYIDGSVKVADLVNKKGGRIYVTSALTKDLKVSIATAADVEQGVAIILGGNGYTMTAADVSHITLSLPNGFEWKYNEAAGGIVVSTASGITAPHSTHPVAVDSYTIKGHKVPASHQGITIQRMSDGTVVKIYSPK